MDILDQGSCFGFHVRSETPFHCLREGGGPPLEVRVSGDVTPDGEAGPIMEWTEPGAQHAYARLHQTGSRYWLWSAGAGWSLIEPELPRITLTPYGDPPLREELVWTIPAALCLLRRGDLVLHAGAVEVDGRAILLGAPGHSGKSTLAAAFARAGHRVLSEDASCVRMDARPAAVPGPAMLRLRRDAAAHVTLPGARVLRRTSSRLTLALDPSGRGTCDPLPLRAVVLLESSPDGFALRQLGAADAIRRLLPLAFRTPSDREFETCFAQLAALTGRVPVFTFARPLRFQALEASVAYLVRG